MSLPTPNYTQVPNVILDAMTQLKPAELRVIMAICRNTFGYHHASRKLSISFLMTATGLSNRSVIDACKGLIEKHWIERHPTGQSWEYTVTAEIKTCEKSSQANTCTSEKSSQVNGSTCEKSSQVPVKKVHTINKEVNKDLLLKKEGDVQTKGHKYEQGLTPYQGSDEFMGERPWILKWRRANPVYSSAFLDYVSQRLSRTDRYKDGITQGDVVGYVGRINVSSPEATDLERLQRLNAWWNEWQVERDKLAHTQVAAPVAGSMPWEVAK